MKKLFTWAVLALSGAMLAPRYARAADGWSRIKDSDGIRVYERAVPGTPLMEYMGVTTIEAKMEVIGEVLRDVPRFRQWLANCQEARVLKNYSRNDMVIYMILNPPVIQVRDIILKDRTVYDFESGKAAISFEATGEMNVPTDGSRVRVTTMKGLFSMDYLGRSKTKFIYRLMVDPAGNIPRKIAYAVMKNYPYDTLVGLKKMVVIPKYSSMAKGTEEEKQINLRANSEAAIRKILTNRLVKFVRDGDSLRSIIAAENDGIRAIAAADGSYAQIEKTTTDIYLRYFAKTITDREEVEKLKRNRALIAEITDMVISDCGATSLTADGIAAKYRKK